MAKLFLSYSRKDAARARRFSQWLESDGHDVWRDDDDISAGASFSLEIEKALKKSDAVLVLWSKASIDSAWVRDEAGFGRDAGKLIPLSLDGTEPPLGFRQFQSVGLSRWKGHTDPPEADRIRAAIAKVTSVPQSERSQRVPARHGWLTGPFRKPALAGGIVAVVAAIVLATFLWQRWNGDQQIAIAVMPSSQSSDRAMAADYANVAAADLAAFLPRRFDRATVITPDDASGGGPAYRMQISTNAHGRGVDASLALSDAQGHTTLWSKNWSVADASAADLKAEVSATASKAALCLTDARGGRRRLSQPALGLYLSGCTSAGDTKLSNTDFETIFERVTKLAPDFGPGWDYLALSRSWIAEGFRDGSQAAYGPALESARKTIAVARRMNPNSAISYDAEYHLISSDTLRALQVLERGAKIDPNDGRIQMHLADGFLSVGRVSDSVHAAERGVELEPTSPYTRSQYISALVYAGEFSKAKADIAEARAKWPNDPAIDFADFGYQLRYGDPRAALELLPRIGDFSDADLAPTRKVIAARLDPTPAKIGAAIAALNDRWGNNPSTRNNVFRALGSLGRVGEAYELLEDPKFQPFVETGVLFRPDFAGVRADPRFMQVAARLGLVRYWRTSGYWPDFCTNERLPYDCRKEASKYA